MIVMDLFKLDESWKNVSTIIPFGLGRIGKRVLPKLLETFQIPFIIDNGNAGQVYRGINVYSLEDALPLIQGRKIVVVTIERIYVSISEQLREAGYTEYSDYCIFERFVEEWHYKYEKKCYLPKLDTAITSKCSLQCGHCAMFTPYCKDRKDCTLEELKENFEQVFQIVDYVFEYTLFGGEPFLHTQLAGIIEYLGRNCAEKIGQIVIITNGTVVPNDELLLVLQRYKVILSISDYTAVNPYTDILSEFTGKLNEYGIQYYVNREIEWKDHCFPEHSCDYDEEYLPEHMRVCGYTCHSVNEGKLYYCDVAWGARKHVGYQDCEDDYVNLYEIQRNIPPEQAKFKILEYCMGNVNAKGYISLCRYCAGMGADNNRVIQAGT